MALVALGIVLLGIQTMYYIMSTNVFRGPTGVSQTAHHPINPYFGLIGLVTLLVGVAIIAILNRINKRDWKDAGK